MIGAHGGKLINRISECKEMSDMEKVELDSREASDLELIGYGGYSPLEGFMCREDYEGVLDNMRLKNGIAWSLPITLATER